MKKWIHIIAISLILFTLFSFDSYANDYENLWDNIDDQTKKYLEDIGVDEIGFNELFEITPTRIIEFVFKLAFEKAENLLPKIIRIVAVIIILAISLSFLKESNNLTNIISSIGVLVILSFIIEPVSRMLTDTITGIKLSTIFNSEW